jgi:hypothetical protein
LASRLPGSALAVSALGLFAATFAPWFEHEELDERRLRESRSVILALSGWELEGEIAVLVLLAVFMGVGVGIWSIRRPENRWLPISSWLAVVAGAAAAWVIAAELRSPSDSVYNDPRIWGRVALAAAVATAAAALLTGVAALARRTDEDPGRAVWPVVAGAAALYLLALGVNATEVWQPQLLAASCAAGVIGYLAPRWWLALLPLVFVGLVLGLTPDSGGESLRGVIYGLVAAIVSIGLLIGIATRVLRRRALRQQQV